MAQPLRQEKDVIAAQLQELDPKMLAWGQLKVQYVRQLLAIAGRYEGIKDWLGAVDTYNEVLVLDPANGKARNLIEKVRRKGGSEVAVEDAYAGGDPTGGVSKERMDKLDRRHTTWETAWEDKSENYSYRTNAGYLVLKTSAIAMEQMNRFYRRFFRFKEKGGKTPRIEIRIFKSRDEYLEHGSNPVEWSGGQFTGSAVETYVGGATGKETIRQMYGTLFHEAAHQFVSLTGPFVPGWLNEAYASFFEGCVILSNGTVKWNRPVPHRLLPLAARLDRGWMSGHSEAAPSADGKFPSVETAPRIRTIVESEYRWGPPWYAPTWGLVYFLYNFRDGDGQTVYREALYSYYNSFDRGRPNDPIANFETIILQGSKRSTVTTIDELDDIWKKWILRLRDTETGKIEVGGELLGYAASALERNEPEAALEFLREAYEDRPDDPEVLWLLAKTLQQTSKFGISAARYREFRNVLELAGKTDDERYDEADDAILKLDPMTKTARELRATIATEGIALAKDYESRELPMMALEISMRMSSRFSMPEALDYYAELAGRTGVSLARWRLAYDERSLDGWSGDTDIFRAYGRNLQASVDAGDMNGIVATRELVCDVTFDGDFSLEASVKIDEATEGEGYAGSLIGLCFGRKGPQDFRGVMLHPKGYLDIASQIGGAWSTLDHRQIPVGPEWHRLRIDVTGRTLDVYFDGLYVRSMDFASEGIVRGGFGLIAGTGKGQFRDIRLLARDPFDPAARIEREIAISKVMDDSALRVEGSFTGFRPPELEQVIWHDTEAVTLEALRGRPALVAFWSIRQDEVIPTSRYLQNLAERGAKHDVPVIVVCARSVSQFNLEEYLKEHPMAPAKICRDSGGKIFDKYFVKAGFFGMPRMLLLDEEGRVVFEGDPGLKKDIGWSPGDPSTFVDGAFDRLLEEQAVRDGKTEPVPDPAEDGGDEVSGTGDGAAGDPDGADGGGEVD